MTACIIHAMKPFFPGVSVNAIRKEDWSFGWGILGLLILGMNVEGEIENGVQGKSSILAPITPDLTSQNTGKEGMNNAGAPTILPTTWGGGVEHVKGGDKVLMGILLSIPGQGSGT